MERHQVGQEEELAEVKMETKRFVPVDRPRGSLADRRRSFKCAVAMAAVMGFVTAALVAGFIHHFSLLKSSCKQVG